VRGPGFDPTTKKEKTKKEKKKRTAFTPNVTEFIGESVNIAFCKSHWERQEMGLVHAHTVA
jgi:hypothetical protein